MGQVTTTQGHAMVPSNELMHFIGMVRVNGIAWTAVTTSKDPGQVTTYLAKNYPDPTIEKRMVEVFLPA
jgi:hypothetical protein